MINAILLSVVRIEPVISRILGQMGSKLIGPGQIGPNKWVPDKWVPNK